MLRSMLFGVWCVIVNGMECHMSRCMSCFMSSRLSDCYHVASQGEFQVPCHVACHVASHVLDRFFNVDFFGPDRISCLIICKRKYVKKTKNAPKMHKKGLFDKSPEYGRKRISWRVQLVASVQFKYKNFKQKIKTIL